jgi:lysophospholipase L1-like esterase
MDYWIGTWSASPMTTWPGDSVLYGFHQQTVRQVLRISKGGRRLRIRFSNECGTSAIKIGCAIVAKADKDGRIQPDTNRQLTFGGESEAFLVSGAPLLSDAVDLPLADLEQIAVSVYLPEFAPIETYHYEAQQTAYISEFGNFSKAIQMPVQQTSTSRYFLTAVLVECHPDCGSVVCLGDSITDGFGSTTDGNARWPDQFAERLAASGRLGDVSVLNQGIGGNRLLTSRGRGLSALARFDRDVLSFPAVKWLAVLEGINDIGWPETMLAGEQETVSARQMIAAYRQLIARARLHGIKVLLGTLAPFGNAVEGLPLRTFYSPAKESKRRSVNDWIRNFSEADAVANLDQALADPSNPSMLLPIFDCGDHIHPSDAGYHEIAKQFERAFESLS